MSSVGVRSRPSVPSQSHVVQSDSGDEGEEEITTSMSSFFAGDNQPTQLQKPQHPVQPQRTATGPPAQGMQRPPVRTSSGGPTGINGPTVANGQPRPQQQMQNGQQTMQPRPQQRPASGGPQQFAPRPVAAGPNGPVTARGPPGSGQPLQQRPMQPNPNAQSVQRPAPPSQPQQRMSGGPTNFPRTSSLNMSPEGVSGSPSSSPQGEEDSTTSPSNSNNNHTTPSSSSSDAATFSLRAQLDKLTQEYRAYKRQSQEDLDAAKRQRLSLQNQLTEASNRAQESERQLAESSSRVSELQNALQKSRAAAETELNFFNLEVEKEIARSKQDREKVKLQQTLQSYQDAHKQNKKIIETLNGEIVKLKQAYKALAGGQNPTSNGSAGISVTSAPNDKDSEIRALKAELARLTNEKGSGAAAAGAGASTSNGGASAVSFAALQAELLAAQQAHKASLAEWQLKHEHAVKELAEVKHAALNSTSSSNSAAAQKQLESERAELQEKLSQSSTELKSVQSKLGALESEHAGLQSQYQSVQNEITSLRSGGDHEKLLQDSTERLAQVEKQSMAQIKEKDAKIATLSASLQEEKSTSSKLTTQLNDQRSSLQRAEELNKKLKEDLTASNTQKNHLSGEVAHLTAELAQSKSNLANSISTVAEMRDSFTQAQALHETQLKERWAQIASLQKELEQLKQAASDAKSSFESQIKELKSSAQSAAENADKRMGELTQSNTDLTTKLNDLTHTYESDKSRFSSEISTLQSALTAERASLAKLLQDSAEQEQELKSQLSQKHDALVQAQDERKEFGEASASRESALNASVTSLSSQLEQTSQELSELRVKSTAEISELNGQVDRLERKVLELSVQLKDKKSALAAYHEQIEFNTRRRAEIAKSIPVKKPGLLGSLAKRLHLDDKDPREEDAVDMFQPPPNGSSGSLELTREQKDQQNELAEEVAVSLTKRLQQSESERAKLEVELQKYKDLAIRQLGEKADKLAASSIPRRR